MTSPFDRRHFLKGSAIGLSLVACRTAPTPGPSARCPAPTDKSKPPVPAAGAGQIEINPATFAAAEVLAVVEYTPKERAQLVESANDLVELVKARRGYTPSFEIPPAVRFDPRLPGWVPPKTSSKLIFSKASGDTPKSDEDLAYASVGQLAEWLRRKVVSSTRLTELYLERLERIGPKLECVITLTKDRALEVAKQADEDIARGRIKSAVHGVPWGAKDIIDTKGIQTSFGATPYKGRVPDRDATVVERLEAARAPLVAKLSTGALAYWDLWYGGKTKNPWNLEEGSNGSSAGPASATAAALVGFAVGSETLGSITAPSARCGATGLRPTFGRVPRSGVMPLSWSLDKLGPIARTVEDTARVLAVIHGRDDADPASVTMPFGFNPAEGHKAHRVGYVPAWFEGEGASEVVRSALDAAKASGMELVEIEPVELPIQSLLMILFAESGAALEELTLTNRDDLLRWQDKDAWPNTLRLARFISAVDLVQAERLRFALMRRFEAIFQKVDAIIGPASNGPMLIATNFTGHPSVTLRAGFEEHRTREGLASTEKKSGPLFRVPVAINLWGRLYDEGTLLALGGALEAKLGVFGERPPLS